MRTRSSPLFTHPTGQLGIDVERLFDTIWNQSMQPQRFQAPLATPRPRNAFPALNLWEDDQNLLIEAEIPGLAMSDIELLIQGDQLTLRGQRRPAEQEKATFLRQERWTGRFERTLTLPAPVDQDKVEASLHNGILTITLPKAASARPRKIEIKSLPAMK
jgi:HSP20 family protein